MGLRDHGLVDYYIPLVAGPDEAKRNRFRLSIPFDIYVPSSPSGVPIGGGDGGYGTPIDATINRPTITFPNSGDHTGITDCDTITSSAFGSTNGQTHIASRWVAELIDVGGSLTVGGTPSIVYDSGPTLTVLESLPLLTRGAIPLAAYQIRVRYKGSHGGWSDWSNPQPFVMRACGYECGLNTYIQSFSTSFDGTVLTTYTFHIDPPPATAGWSNLKAYISEAGWDDAGSITGNLDSVSGTAFFGPEVYVSNDGLGLAGSVTNTAGPLCGVTATIRWTGIL